VQQKQKILILGGSGLLGLNLIYHLRTQFDITSTFHLFRPKINCSWTKFDVNNIESLPSLTNYDCVINCIGLTNVDTCEISVVDAYKLNSHFPHFLAKACAQFECKLIHISTDNFDSSPGEIRDENVVPIPVNAYGRSKLEGEHFVLSASSQNLVFRTNFFGFAREDRNSLLQWVLTESQVSEQIKAITNIYFNPVSTQFFSSVIRESIAQNFQGLYNLSNDSCISKLDFVKLVLACLNLHHINVSPIQIDELKLTANRPKVMCLNNDKIKEILPFSIPSLNSMIFDEIKDMMEKQSYFLSGRRV
jgi:dTDP-4-dehydrorhamnose reductase